MEIRLFSDQSSEAIRFGAEYFVNQLALAGIRALLSGSDCAPPDPKTGEIITQMPPVHGNLFGAETGLSPDRQETYRLERTPSGGWCLSAAGCTGIMYGLMDMGETIRLHGFDALKETVKKPAFPFRGVKFNLPFEPYSYGDPVEKNVETCLSFRFWQSYIDMLAVNRYNLLSLWSEHPFHMMFRLAKYPATCPYDDKQLSHYEQLFHFIFRHAHARGIRIAMITWNIRLPEFAAAGLGLPRSMGNSLPAPRELAEALSAGRNDTMNRSRQAEPIVQDYIRECVQTMLTAYPEIDMIGTNCAEEMVDNMEVRQEWVEEAYLEALKRSGRRIPFIMRTNCGSCALAESFLEKCPAGVNYISWKYSYAHLYSAERPQFEEVEKVWDNIRHPEKLNVLFTVRNDDFHTLRWGDDAFIRGYMRGIAEKPYVKGFYWGADGYIYGKDFAHREGGHKVWQYDHEKHWIEFSLFGRIGYDLEADAEYWRAESLRHFGEHGEKLAAALKTASRALPPVNRLHWLNIDIRWHPETLLSRFGFRSVIDTFFTDAMPGVGTTGLRAFAKQEASGTVPEGETPVDIIELLQNIAHALEEDLLSIDTFDLIGEAECLREDLHCWLNWTRFFICRFTAALELARLEVTCDEVHREKALEAAKKECIHWDELDRHWSSHYTGYMKARGNMMTGYGLYRKDVARDQELVRAFGKIPMEPSDFWTWITLKKR
ncbi:MAG: hypothetical protein IJL43_05685 [Lachnospiraceae bacterium]|nr:hypothetical protein [Lachnospiraceae bacterium]